MVKKYLNDDNDDEWTKCKSAPQLSGMMSGRERGDSNLAGASMERMK